MLQVRDATASTVVVHRHQAYAYDADDFHDVRDVNATYRRHVTSTTATSAALATTRKITCDRYDLVHYSTIRYINTSIIIDEL